MFSLWENPKKKKCHREPLINSSSLVALSNLYVQVPNISSTHFSSIEAISLMNIFSYLEDRDCVALLQIKALRPTIKTFLKDEHIKKLNIGKFAKSFESHLNKFIDSQVTIRALPKKIALYCLFFVCAAFVLGCLGIIFYGINLLADLASQETNSYKNHLDIANSLYYTMKSNYTLEPQQASPLCKDLTFSSLDKMFLNCAPFKGKGNFLSEVPSWPNLDRSDPDKVLVPCATFIFTSLKSFFPTLFSAFEKNCDNANIDNTYDIGGFLLTAACIIFCFCALIAAKIGMKMIINKNDSIEESLRFSLANSNVAIRNAPPKYTWLIQELKLGEQTVAEVLPKLKTLSKRNNYFFSEISSKSITMVSDREDVSENKSQKECKVLGN